MSHFDPDQIVETIRNRGALRTPGLALVFDMSEGELDAQLAPLCAPGGPLVSCAVEVAGQHVHEYRCSAIGGGKLNDVWSPKPGRPRRAGEPKPAPAFGDPQAVKQALAARFQSAPPAPPAPKPVQPRKEVAAPMTVASRIIAAITKLGPMTVPQIRSLVDEKILATTCSQLARKKKLVKLGGGSHSTIYGLPGQKVKAGAAASRKPKPAPVRKGDGDKLYIDLDDGRKRALLACALRGRPFELQLGVEETRELAAEVYGA